MKEKVCTCCKELLPIGFFWKKVDTKDGYTNYCVPCIKSKKLLNSYLKPVDLDGEVWKDFPDYESVYQISNKGRVKSLSRQIIHRGTPTILPEILMRQHTTNKGYKSFRTCVNYKTRLILIHVAVARAFIPNPENKTDVNHIDGDKGNNDLSNLEWNTRSENLKHAYRLGLMSRKGIVVKKTPVIRIDSDGNVKEYDSLNDAKKEGFTTPSVSRCCKKETKSYKGYKWEFK